MYINTGVGEGGSRRDHKISIVAWDTKYPDSDDHPSIRLEIYKTDHGMTNWVGVSLTPRQAVRVAHRILNPLGYRWGAFADPEPEGPKGELRPFWDIMKVKHKNGVHDGTIAIKRERTGNPRSDKCYPTETTIAIHTMSWETIEKSHQSECFWSEHEEAFTPPEAKRIAGFLYHWGGALMIGYEDKTIKTTERWLPLVKDDDKEEEDWDE